MKKYVHKDFGISRTNDSNVSIFYISQCNATSLYQNERNKYTTKIHSTTSGEALILQRIPKFRV